MLKAVVFVAAVLSAVNCTELRFGFPSRPRSLSDDLLDFVGLLPLDEYRMLIREYVAGDSEAQQIFRYLQGPEWATLVGRVRDNPTWISFKEFAASKGVDVDNIVDQVHDLINGVEVPDAGGDMGGFRALVDEIKDITPFDGLLALLDEKLTNSEDFRELFSVISSQEARDFLNELLGDAEVERLLSILREFGIDIDRIIEVIKEILGWTRQVVPGVPVEYL